MVSSQNDADHEVHHDCVDYLGEKALDHMRKHLVRLCRVCLQICQEPSHEVDQAVRSQHYQRCHQGKSLGPGEVYHSSFLRLRIAPLY